MVGHEVYDMSGWELGPGGSEGILCMMVCGLGLRLVGLVLVGVGAGTWWVMRSMICQGVSWDLVGENVYCV